MYKHFNQIIKVSSFYALNENYGIYLSFKEAQLSEVQDLLTFAYETSEGQLHTDFIKSYALNMQEHIESLKRYKLLLESASEELLKLLNSFGELGQVLVSEGFDYSLYIDVDTLYFFKSIGYDSYLRSEGYMIIELLRGKKGYKTNQLSVGFTSKSLDELKNEPSFIKRQISKFKDLNTAEDINEHMEYCNRLLFEYFDVKEIYELINLKDSIAKQLLGEPLEVYKEIYNTARFHSIKCSLPSDLKEIFNDDIYSLIVVENNISNKEAHKEILDNEKYIELCERLENRKKMLMESLSIDQNLLDEYMSYVPKEEKD
ncbi:hypothetical protein [Lysinibacillus boronitolerans]|uniref:hypothetical protein n=1 Tax=Lysinibacillus boronitolerans TaxID=309788 RepID=UPI003854AC69